MDEERILGGAVYIAKGRRYLAKINYLTSSD